MKRFLTGICLSVLVFTALPVFAVTGPTSIRVTPPAPKFTDAERHAELAKRRAAVAAKMADNSTLILPGDEILVPPRIDRKVFQHAMEISQIMYQIAIAASVLLRV